MLCLNGLRTLCGKVETKKAIMIKALQIFAILSTIGAVSCGMFPLEEVYDADGECVRDNCTSASQTYTSYAPNTTPWQ